MKVSVFVLTIVVYVICSIFIINLRSEIHSQNLKIVELHDKVFWLKQVNEISTVLEQILTPLQVDELKLLAEQKKQRKLRSYLNE